MTTMFDYATTAHKGPDRTDASTAETTAADTIVADLQCRGWGGWDARDVLAGRLDDTTVRQAAEVQR